MISFFFQAEDGIRDGTVTGVQTCALPIFARVHGVDRLARELLGERACLLATPVVERRVRVALDPALGVPVGLAVPREENRGHRSEEHTSELQSQFHLVCRLLLEKKKKTLV